MISLLFSESCSSVVPAPKRVSSCCSASGSGNAPVIAAEDPAKRTFAASKRYPQDSSCAQAANGLRGIEPHNSSFHCCTHVVIPSARLALLRPRRPGKREPKHRQGTSSRRPRDPHLYRPYLVAVRCDTIATPYILLQQLIATLIVAVYPSLLR